MSIPPQGAGLEAPAGESVPDSLEELGGWPAVLGHLAGHHDLSELETSLAFAEVLAGNATSAQVAAFIFGLRCKGETVAEMTGLVRSLLAVAEPLPLDDDLRSRLIDTCGTGGDRLGTFNISTVAAFVVAGAGVPVCKHGGRAASSRAGSADLLEALGVAIDLGPRGVVECIDRVGIGFCFAPRFHSALRHAAPTRRELGVPTTFNFCAPLANPARLQRQVVGAGDPAMADKMAAVLAGNGARHAWVVCGHDGMDELSTTGLSTVVEYRMGAPIRTTVLDASSLGLARTNLSELAGGDAQTNAALARRVLEGERSPRRDVVLLNAAAGLVVGGAVTQLAEGLELAAAAVDDGRAAACLDCLVTTSQTLRASGAG